MIDPSHIRTSREQGDYGMGGLAVSWIRAGFQVSFRDRAEQQEIDALMLESKMRLWDMLYGDIHRDLCLIAHAVRTGRSPDQNLDRLLEDLINKTSADRVKQETKEQP